MVRFCKIKKERGILVFKAKICCVWGGIWAGRLGGNGKGGAKINTSLRQAIFCLRLAR